MRKTRKQLLEMSKKGRKSPRVGKRGKNKTTLAFEKALKDRAEHIIDDMLIERSRVIKLMKGKISKAKYRDLVDGLDKLTKNIQLLGGKDTGKVTFTWEK